VFAVRPRHIKPIGTGDNKGRFVNSVEVSQTIFLARFPSELAVNQFKPQSYRTESIQYSICSITARDECITIALSVKPLLYGISLIHIFDAGLS
jgi:hypothetical protein